jgi:hypothetical protein
MRSTFLRILWRSTLVTILAAGAGAANAADSKAAAAAPETTKIELAISKDGRSIVDQNGKVIAQFVKGTRVQLAAKDGSAKLLQSTPQAGTQKMKGCMRCYPVCVVYEGSRCVSWARTCDWDFDC